MRFHAYVTMPLEPQVPSKSFLFFPTDIKIVVTMFILYFDDVYVKYTYTEINLLAFLFKCLI